MFRLSSLFSRKADKLIFTKASINSTSILHSKLIMLEIKMDNTLGKMNITTVEVQGGILDKELQITIQKTESTQSVK